MDTRRLLEEFPGYLEANRLARPLPVSFLRSEKRVAVCAYLISGR